MTETQKSSAKLPFWTIWNLSFGFFGVQIAYSLQGANISRIFSTLGADPNNISGFWLLPPLAGMIVQPIVGYFSDKTWCKLGRRIPYLIVGAALAVVILCLLPNSGNFGFGFTAAMAFGATCIMLLDVSSNMAMQPFKMLVGDMVSEEQKGFAYSIQNFLINAGSFVAFFAPMFLTICGVSNDATGNKVPDSVIYSFYIGAVILILCAIYTVWKVRELPPAEYAEFHGMTIEEMRRANSEKTVNLLKKAPKIFWQLAVVQFFCWFAFTFLSSYLTGCLAENVWHTVDVTSVGYQDAGNWNGVYQAVEAVGGILWALVLTRVKNRKPIYMLSLFLGAIGFTVTSFSTNLSIDMIAAFLVGCGWASIGMMPFTMLTNALGGRAIGRYLGLFNTTICLPQIVAALLGLVFMPLFGSQMHMMFLLAGISMALGAICVSGVKETYASEEAHAEN